MPGIEKGSKKMPKKEILHPIFSLVIPIFNEEKNIEELYKRIIASMQQVYAEQSTKPESSDSKEFEKYFEIILIDDGSKDSSWDLI